MNQQHNGAVAAAVLHLSTVPPHTREEKLPTKAPLLPTPTPPLSNLEQAWPTTQEAHRRP